MTFIPSRKLIFYFAGGLLMLLVACAPQAASTPPSAEPLSDAETTRVEPELSPAEQSIAPIDPSKYDDFEIITLLPPDAIPAIDDPQFLSPDEAADEYAPDELVLGVFINGEARAYSVPHLSSHEIVNDTVGGQKISVTW